MQGLKFYGVDIAGYKYFVAGGLGVVPQEIFKCEVL